jgi:hypothetical protein
VNRRSSLSLVIAALLAIPSVCPAQGFIERIEPPLAQRGKTTRVTFIGSALAQGVDVWASLPAGAIKATPVAQGDVANREAARSVVDLQVAADAPVGLCGLRLATRDGLSNVHLFLIDDLPSIAKPTGTSALKTPLPAAVWGNLSGAAVERFTIEVAAGQWVSFEAVGNRFGKDVDPLVTIRDSAGKRVAERDNDVGLGFDCRFAHTFVTAGSYTVELRDSRFQAPEHSTYVLRMGRFPAGRVAVPSVVKPGQRNELRLPEVGDDRFTLDIPAKQPLGPLVAALRRPGGDGATWVPLLASSADVTVAEPTSRTMEQAAKAKVPGILCGVLDQPGARDFFRLDLDKGQRIRVRGEARPLHSPADLELAIVDAKGAELRRASDPGRDEVTLDFAAPAAGPFYLTARDLSRDGGPAFAYRIDVRAPEPTFTVTADTEGLTLPQGGYQSVPLVVTRSEKFGIIKFRLAGAPPGVTLSPDEIAEGDTTLVAKLSAGADAPKGIHTVQIVAEAANERGPSPILVRTMPLIDRKRVNVDLIPYALREDQLRLPAPLHDRLAVQITPAAPFTFDLSEATVTLGRYQQADIPIRTTRTAGFDGAIKFTARGGQIGPKDDIRSRVFAEFPSATSAALEMKGSIHSRILSNIGKTRIEVEGTAMHEGRRITLTRSFELDLRPAFRVSGPTEKLTLAPGSTTKVKLLANRLPTFDGAITVQLNPPAGFELPAQVELPRGQDSIEIEVTVPPKATHGRVQLRARCVATVGTFEEEQQALLLEIEIPKPESPKK